MLSRETDAHSRQYINRLKRGRRTWPTPNSANGHLGIDSSGMGSLLPGETREISAKDANKMRGDIPEGLARGISLSERTPSEVPKTKVDIFPIA